MMYPFLLNYIFKNISYLHQALRHPSVVTRQNNLVSYERLEFLGDSVLGFIIAEWLIDFYKEESEGNLARRHAYLVCGECISAIARSLQLGDFLDISEGDVMQGGRFLPRNLENALEAIIGALYLDGGMEVARHFVLHHWKDMCESTSLPPQDPKTLLQEWAQSKGKPLPLYALISSSGSAHLPVFEMEVCVAGYPPTSGKGSSKRLAEREAARFFYERIIKHA